MLILLPPSEGKAAPSEGAPLDLAELAYADALGEERCSCSPRSSGWRGGVAAER